MSVLKGTSNDRNTRSHQTSERRDYFLNSRSLVRCLKDHCHGTSPCPTKPGHNRHWHLPFRVLEDTLAHSVLLVMVRFDSKLVGVKASDSISHSQSKAANAPPTRELCARILDWCGIHNDSKRLDRNGEREEEEEGKNEMVRILLDHKGKLGSKAANDNTLNDGNQDLFRFPQATDTKDAKPHSHHT